MALVRSLTTEGETVHTTRTPLISINIIAVPHSLIECPTVLPFFAELTPL